MALFKAVFHGVSQLGLSLESCFRLLVMYFSEYRYKGGGDTYRDGHHDGWVAGQVG